MKVEPTDLPGVRILHRDVHDDHRGYFQELYRRNERFRSELGTTFVQDNLSCSKRDVLRGLHYQLQHPQEKLVQVISGEIYDVAVDLRRDSSTFGQWTGLVLTGGTGKQVFIPGGFAHGFCVTSETAHVVYKCSDFYRPDDQHGVIWNDPQLDIDWPVSDPVLSEKDRSLPGLPDASLPEIEQ